MQSELLNIIVCKFGWENLTVFTRLTNERIYGKIEEKIKYQCPNVKIQINNEINH